MKKEMSIEEKKLEEEINNSQTTEEALARAGEIDSANPLFIIAIEKAVELITDPTDAALVMKRRGIPRYLYDEARAKRRKLAK